MEEKSPGLRMSEAFSGILREVAGDREADCAGGLYWYVVESVERPLIEIALERTRGNKIRAAKLLGINRNTLHAKIRQFDIDAGKYR